MALLEAFRALGLAAPKVCLTTYSVPLRMDLIATGPYITIFPGSIRDVRADRFSFKVLPIDLPVRPPPLAIVTLKNRMLNPVAERFIEHVRDYATARAA
jgi:DNA-binding transcriptional LysR family regulator